MKIITLEYLKAFAEVKKFWILACNHDRINPDGKFVVLSDKNPHKKNYEQAIGRLLLLELKRQTH